MVTEEIKSLIDRKALFVINHSGGKDSQAMTIYLQGLIPKEQLVIVHSHLPEVEWDGSIDHINQYANGIPVHVTQSVKTFFEMVDHRRMFPDAGRRQCTSDLKRGPIEKKIRHILKEKGQYLIVNCMGMRAEESPNRSKLTPFKLNERNSIAGREWYDWLPIHDWLTPQVFKTIHDAGERAFWIYYKGMTRKSCSFCIMGSRGDLKLAAQLRPELYKRYVDKERELNHTLQMSKKTLEEVTGIYIYKQEKGQLNLL
jgi:DNA sulfur modification protein DndC